MRILKLYLDTSIVSFALADDISEQDREITCRLCEEINNGKFEGFISEVVLRELSNTKYIAKRDKFFKFLEVIELNEVLNIDKEVIDLASKYIDEKIIPAQHMDDALHIALSSVNGLDILVSWNFKHLVRHKTRVEVTGVNTLLGYKNVDICSPWEVVEDV
ncbi:MAG: PIN domain-containing protein [Planctomycetota bacterium]|jgi:predicted nucleic acid-binding protein